MNFQHLVQKTKRVLLTIFIDKKIIRLQIIGGPWGPWPTQCRSPWNAEQKIWNERMQIFHKFGIGTVRFSSLKAHHILLNL